jgi:large subunit ribosomal protein L25
MREIPLSATMRTKRGRGFARQARREGKIPGVVYGPEIEPMALVVDEREFRAAMKSASGGSVFDLNVDGVKNKAIVRDIQRDPVTSKVIHVDFHAISMNKPINVFVPISFIGTARGVKTDGGIMQTTMRELEISCLPANIPDKIDIDVSDLGIGDSVHVRDISIPEANILSEERRTIVVISAPTIVKAEVTAEEAEEAEEAVEEGAEEAAEGAEGTEGAEEQKKSEKKEEKS